MQTERNLCTTLDIGSHINASLQARLKAGAVGRDRARSNQPVSPSPPFAPYRPLSWHPAHDSKDFCRSRSRHAWQYIQVSAWAWVLDTYEPVALPPCTPLSGALRTLTTRTAFWGLGGCVRSCGPTRSLSCTSLEGAPGFAGMDALTEAVGGGSLRTSTGHPGSPEGPR